ncbi:hypothetical protein F0726_02807 [Acidithiobacillus caldus]|nr:hypothetical protein F0726_02807 [Acidithiobacillus caldus]
MVRGPESAITALPGASSVPEFVGEFRIFAEMAHNLLSCP